MKSAPTTPTAPTARRIARPAALTAALVLATWTGVEHVTDLESGYGVPLTASLPGALGLGAGLLYLFGGLVDELLPERPRVATGLPSDTQITSASSPQDASPPF